MSGSSIGYRPSLDGLRAIACLMVYAYHFGWLSGGFFGVDVFFVLSGYLITSILCQEHARRGEIDLAKFYLRRFLRLAPALFVFVGAAWAVARAIAPAEVETRWALFTIFYVSNLAISYGKDYPMGFLSHCWTLGMEEQFYLLWPLALRVLLGRRLSPRSMLIGLGTAIVACVALRMFLVESITDVNDSWLRTYFAPDTRADMLLAGCALAIWDLHRGGARKMPRWSSAAIAVIGALFLGQISVTAEMRDVLSHPLILEIAAASSVMLIVGSKDTATIFARVLSLTPLVWLGKLSYSLYLWHGLATVIATHLPLPESISPYSQIVLPFFFAAASYYVVERPFLRLKKRFSAS